MLNCFPGHSGNHRPFNNSYTTNDRVHRADIIIYRSTDSTLRGLAFQKDSGNDNGYQVLLKNRHFRSLQLIAAHGKTIRGNQARVKAVEFAGARPPRPERYRDTNPISSEALHSLAERCVPQKSSTSIIKTRNIGL